MSRGLLALAALALAAAAPPALAPGAAAAARYPQWGGLEPGPYGVGFTVVQAYDYTRPYWPRTDWRGRPAEGETARPMQLAIWYPARAAAQAEARGARAMTFGDYLRVAGGELGAGLRADSLRREVEREFRGGPLAPYFEGGVSDSAYRRVLATPVAAVRDAPPAAGRFPVLANGGIGGPLTHSVRMEYLASHGYVVVAIPLLNSGPAFHGRGEWTAKAMQAAAEDVGFVYGFVRSLPYADRDRFAVVGMGSHAGVLFQMRTMRLSALASLEGQYPEALRRSPDYDLARVRVPVLDAMNSDYNGDRVDPMLDSMRYADRWVLRFADLPHAQTYQFPRVAHPERAAEQRGYEVVSRYALEFFDATLKGDTAAAAYLARAPEGNGLPPGFMTVRHLPAQPAVPTEGELLLLVREGRVNEAAAAYAEATARDSAYRGFSYQALADVAFFVMRDHGPRVALGAYQLLLAAYPGVPRTHYMMAQAHERLGDRDGAVRELERALAALSSSPSIAEAERARWDRDIRGQIERLRR